MSDYKDVIKSAMDKGILLDSCGSDERQYWWGLYNDLCGMSVEDALSVQWDGKGEEDEKKKNTLTLTMQSVGADYNLFITADEAPTADMLVMFTMDGVQQAVTLPAGTKSLNTGLKAADGYKYATIANISISGEDEKYTYTSKNNVKTGYFNLVIIDDGVQVENSMKRYNEELTYELPADKTGYEFTRKGDDGKEYTDTFTMPEYDLRITGTYKKLKFALAFTVTEEYLDSLISNPLPTREYESGETSVSYGDKILPILSKHSAARTGYTSGKWIINGEEVTSAMTMPAEAISAEFTYSLNQYTLKYASDGEVYSSESKYYGETITPITENPTKTGYNFVGWDKAEPATMPAKDVTLTAKFEAIDYYIYYYIDDELKYSDKHIYGDAISIRADEEKEGYTFSGWEPSSLPATMPDEDIAVSATFTINQYTIKYYDGWGDKMFEETIDYGTALTPVDDPEKVGYTFTGWDPEVPATMPAHDINTYAQFEVNVYNLTYMVDGEIYKTVPYEYEAVVEHVEPEKEGYEFIGWEPFEPETMPAADFVATAKFEAIPYTIKYFVDGTQSGDTETYHFGDTIEIKPNPEDREGYTFSGWDTELPATMPSHDIEINGEYNINTYKLTYYVDGEQYKQYEIKYGETIEAEPFPEDREGYTFSNWNPKVPATMPAYDVDEYGTFIPNEYQLSFEVDGVEVSGETRRVAYGTIVPTIEIEDAEGCTFSGWENWTSGMTMPAHDLVLSGRQLPNDYTLTYYVDGEFYSAETHTYNTPITPIAEPEKEGYTFSGWDNVPAVMPGHPVDVNGSFEVNVHTVSFYIEDELFASGSCNYGETISTPEAPEREGYNFEWKDVPATMPDEDIDIYGEYSIRSHTLTFHIDGRTDTAQTVEYGTVLAELYPEIEVEEGYVLKWEKDVPTTMPDYDLTINGEIVEFTPSTDIYYGHVMNDEVEDLSSDAILKFSSYDGAVLKENTVNISIPLSQQYIDYMDAADNADAEGRYDEAEMYLEMADEWSASHQHAFIFAMPQGTVINEIEVGGLNRINPVFVKNIEIDGTPYTVTSFSNSQMREVDRVKNFKISIKLV